MGGRSKNRVLLVTGAIILFTFSLAGVFAIIDMGDKETNASSQSLSSSETSIGSISEPVYEFQEINGEDQPVIVEENISISTLMSENDQLIDEVKIETIDTNVSDMSDCVF